MAATALRSFELLRPLRRRCFPVWFFLSTSALADPRGGRRRNHRIGGLSCWLNDHRGVAGVEFALIAPVMVLLAISFYDLTSAVIDEWQVTQSAGAIARIATAMAATSSGTNELTIPQATTASSAIFGVGPEWFSLPKARYSVTVSSIVMAQTDSSCTNNCSYKANVAWSLVTQGVGPKRPCGVLNTVADGSKTTGIGLRVDAFTAAPFIIVDVTYNFIPLLTDLFGAGLTMTESVYMGTRIGTDTNWTRLTGDQAAANQCPGYTG
jgi:Flp pilus assembly protein TadG